MKIDAHVHYTPPSLAARLAAYAEQEPLWGLMVAPPDGKKSIQGWATAERMIEDMDRAGVDRVIIQGAYRQSLEGCIEENDEILSLIKRYPQRIAGYAMIYPADGRPSMDELKRCMDGGMVGVGELNPYAQGFSLDGSEFRETIERCIQLNLPVSFHTNEEVGHNYFGKSSTPLRHFYHLAELYPELKIILAHWGGGLLFYEIMPEVKRVMQNVWYDMAASPLLYPTGKMIDMALRCVDHQKILFGSDYPLLIYPGKMKEPGFECFMNEIEACELPDQVLEDIMGNNAARLLGWLKDDRPQLSEKDTPVSSGLLPVMGLVEGEQISQDMAVRVIADTYPSTRKVFEKYGIAWYDSPVPHWESINQAAAARGFNSQDRRKILDDLNTAVR